MSIFKDIALPKEYFQKGFNKPNGYNWLSCHFYFKGQSIVVHQNACDGGSWIYSKGIGDNGLPNKENTDEKNDYRQGVSAITGVFEQQDFDGTNWITRTPTSNPNIVSITGTFCIAYRADGVDLTGPSSIGLRIECTNPDGSKTAYVKIADGPNEDFSTSPDFQELTTF